MDRRLLWFIAWLVPVVVWSWIDPHDRFTWWLESLPAMVGVALLVVFQRRFPLSTLVLVLLWGHCVLLVEPEGVAFIGDIDLTGFGPYYGDASSSLSGFRRSLATLPEIPAKVWVTAHHRGVYTDRVRFMDDLAAYAARIDEREQRLLAMLRESPKTLEQLVAQRLLYPPHYESPWVEAAETRTISQHLTELVEDGRVQADDQGIYRPR